MKAHTVGATPSLLPPVGKVLRAITKEASVFFRLHILLLSLAGHDDN